MNRERAGHPHGPRAPGDGIALVHPLTARLCGLAPGEIVCLCRPGRAAFATVMVSAAAALGRLVLSASDLAALAACPGARVTVRTMENGRHHDRSPRLGSH